MSQMVPHTTYRDEDPHIRLQDAVMDLVRSGEYDRDDAMREVEQAAEWALAETEPA